MFDISLWEMLVVLVVMLFVIGPEQIPKVAFMAGKWLRYLKYTFQGFSDRVTQEIEAEYGPEYQQQQSKKFKVEQEERVDDN